MYKLEFSLNKATLENLNLTAKKKNPKKYSPINHSDYITQLVALKKDNKKLSFLFPICSQDVLLLKLRLLW